MTRLEPDALFLYRERSKGMMCCFVEIDTGSMSKQQLKAKFYRYERWSQSSTGNNFLVNLYRQYGAQEPRPIFSIMVVAADTDRARSRDRAEQIHTAASSFATTHRRLQVTTPDRLQDQVLNVFGRNVWSCVHEQSCVGFFAGAVGADELRNAIQVVERPLVGREQVRAAVLVGQIRQATKRGVGVRRCGYFVANSTPAIHGFTISHLGRERSNLNKRAVRLRRNCKVTWSPFSPPRMRRMANNECIDTGVPLMA